MELEFRAIWIGGALPIGGCGLVSDDDLADLVAWLSPKVPLVGEGRGDAG